MYHNHNCIFIGLQFIRYKHARNRECQTEQEREEERVVRREVLLRDRTRGPADDGAESEAQQSKRL